MQDRNLTEWEMFVICIVIAVLGFAYAVFGGEL